MCKILCSLFLFIVINAGANSILVISENDLNNTLNRASPGDTIKLANGIWENIHISFKGEGTPDAPITLTSESKGKVFLTGNSKLSISGKYLIVEDLHFRNGFISSNQNAVIEFRTSPENFANYCRVTNCTILDYNPNNHAVEYKFVSIYGTNNRLDHCRFEDKSNIGATVVIWTDEFPDYHQIDNNYFGHRPELGENGGESIRCGTSNFSLFDSYSIIEKNLFEGCNGEIEIISNKSGKNIFRQNTFRNCKGLLTLRHGKHSEVYNNYFFGNYNIQGQGGIRIFDENHIIFNNYFQDLNNGSSNLRGGIVLMNGEQNPLLSGSLSAKNVLVANNTFINCKTSVIIGGGKSALRNIPPDSCILTNNLVYSTRGDNVLFEQLNNGNSIFTQNIGYGSPIGINNEMGIWEVDPSLKPLDTANSLRRIKKNSPAVNNADSTYVINLFEFDMDGQLREDKKYDIGADEISDSIVVIHPLSQKDFNLKNDSLYNIIENFRGIQKGTCNHFYWTSLFNPTFFELERKTPFENRFKTIGQLSPTESETHFFELDTAPQPNSVYRIKATLLNNLIYYSNLITIQNFNSVPPGYKAYPNPTKDYINVQIPIDLNLDRPQFILSVFDSSGALIFSKKISGECSVERLQLSDFISTGGLYFIKVNNQSKCLYQTGFIFTPSP